MRLLVFVAIVALFSCGRPTNDQISIGPPDFVVREKVAKDAPELQAHIYRLLPFSSDRFIIKPEFVFLDLDQMTQGQPHPHVVEMQMVHVAYWKEDQMSWSGSVLLGLGRGWMGFSERNYSIRLSGDAKTYDFTFTDGDQKAQFTFDPSVSEGSWHDLGKDRFYMFHFPLPKSKHGVRLPTVHDAKGAATPSEPTDQVQTKP